LISSDRLPFFVSPPAIVLESPFYQIRIGNPASADLVFQMLQKHLALLHTLTTRNIVAWSAPSVGGGFFYKSGLAIDGAAPREPITLTVDSDWIHWRMALGLRMRQVGCKSELLTQTNYVYSSEQGRGW
jgi:hypothetical protein